ncbi:MAG TPA: quinone-dependent dihydroorotate dehydrogenase [Candidatus Poseidoniales archaeon]|nr:quinone-dependent dihydroorotate dehydrogenase [Candidatus Poseidoniales archaeon]
MGLLWKGIVRPMMAVLPISSETFHRMAMRNIRIFSYPGFRSLSRAAYRSPSIPTKLLGVDFDNPVGLAAGMDKKGQNIHCWGNLGFGWIEIGGITMLAQEGNSKPRMFRSVKHRALINRMGLNNPGSEAMAEHLKTLKSRGRWSTMPIGINIGKSKDTPNEDAEQDYASTFERLWEFADLFVINVSSPNTPHLRELQTDSDLGRILSACNEVNERLANDSTGTQKPILIKVAPDLIDEQLTMIADIALSTGCAGIVATNTTTTRPAEGGIMDEKGGLSGVPLRIRATEVIHLLYSHTEGKMPIIGVGGISDGDSAWEKIAAGASLLQVYSALVFEGPGVIRKINKSLNRKLKAHGYQSLSEAVGHAHRS